MSQDQCGGEERASTDQGGDDMCSRELEGLEPRPEDEIRARCRVYYKTDRTQDQQEPVLGWGGGGVGRKQVYLV